MNDKQKELLKKFNSKQGMIESRLNKIKKTAQEAIELAIENGGILIELKGTVEHGEWEGFRIENIKSANKTQCSAYMSLNKNRSYLENSGDRTFKGIDDAYAYIGEQKRIESDKKAQDNIAKAEAVRRRDSKAGYTNNKNVIDVDQDDVYKPTKEDLKFDEKEGDVDDKWKWDDSYESDFASALGGILGSSAVYKESVKRIADALSEADDELINKVRKFMIQNMHPDKVESDKYKEAYLKLTEVK